MLCGSKKALLQNPREMIRGRTFREMFGFRPKSQSYKQKVRDRPKVRVTARETQGRANHEVQTVN